MKRRKFHLSKMVEHEVWRHMLYRCRNPEHPAYRHYGGRGIEVKFDCFYDFYEEVGPKPPTGPSGSYSIHRIYNNGHYEKGNVKWATWKEQAANRRRRLKLLPEIKTQPNVIFLHTRPFFEFIKRTYGRNIVLDCQAECCSSITQE